jgi:hypothetical protein
MKKPKGNNISDTNNANNSKKILFPNVKPGKKEPEDCNSW